MGTTHGVQLLSKMKRKTKNRIGRAQKKSATNVKYWEKENLLRDARKNKQKLKKATQQLSESINEECAIPTDVPADNSFGSNAQVEKESIHEKYILVEVDDECAIIENDHNRESEEQEDSDGFFAHEFFLVTDKVIKYDPCTDLDELYQSRKTERYNILNAELEEMQIKIKRETGYVKSNSKTIQFIDLYPTEIPGVKIVVTINSAFEAEIFAHRKKIGADHVIRKHLPQKYYTSSQVKNLLTKLSGYDVCVGNPDEEFAHLPPGSQEYRESNFGARNGNMTYDTTFRSDKCELLVKALRCKECILKRGALRKRRHSGMHPKVPNSPSISSTTPHKFMTPKQINNKIKQLQRNRRAQNAKIESLRRQLQQSIEKCDELLNGENTDINDMVKECSKTVEKEWPDEDSFQRLFWEEQIKFNAAKTSNGMRWHPMIIKWCLHMKSKSSAAYGALRDTGFVKLPSSRTLYNYSHFMDPKCGITLDVLKHVKGEAKAKGLYDAEYKKYVGILLDEVKIKEDLVYDKYTGELVGYMDLDKTGNQLLQLENEIENKNSKLAKYMLVLMVRGACSDFKYPLACYATDGIKSALLYTVTWDAVDNLELNLGLKVLFITCDGASPNRRFFDLHGDQKPVWYTLNPNDPQRKIYFISDAPHLIKTTRNCFANSDSHKRSRKLWNNGKYISWMHIVDLYQNHCEGRELSAVYKLTRDHVDLTAFSTMKVSLAAQVLSDTVANALERYVGDHTSETVKFIRIMNKFFDCLNTRNLAEGAKTRNANKKPYTNENDDRLSWLTGDFLQFFEDWKTCVENHPGGFTKGEKCTMILSHQTLTGLEITARSIVACVKFLLDIGAPFVLTSHFNQDILEQLFGHFRHRGGCMENPTVKDVRQMMVEVKATRSVHMACVRGNTKRDQENRVIDNNPLPKRARLQ